MTDLSSTEQAELPTPPAPPAPLFPDAPNADAVAVAEPGPATSSMDAVPAEDVIGRGFDSAYTTFTPITTEVIGLPPARPRGFEPPPPPDRKAERKRRVSVRGPRRAKLVLRRVDPWSVLKFSILFSVCLVIIWVIAVSSLFTLLRTMHVFDNINSVLASATAGATGDPTSKGIHIDPTSHQVTEWAAIIGAVNALLFTALATLGAFAYNLVSMLVGGIEVTMAERD